MQNENSIGSPALAYTSTDTSGVTQGFWGSGKFQISTSASKSAYAWMLIFRASHDVPVGSNQTGLPTPLVRST